jgi:hypothetical protein
MPKEPALSLLVCCSRWSNLQRICIWHSASRRSLRQTHVRTTALHTTQLPCTSSPAELPYTTDASRKPVTVLTCWGTPAASRTNWLRLKCRLLRVPWGLGVPLSVKLDIQGSAGGTVIGWLELSAGTRQQQHKKCGEFVHPAAPRVAQHDVDGLAGVACKVYRRQRHGGPLWDSRP